MEVTKKLDEINKRVEAETEARFADSQMNFWPDDKRAAPNAMVRCSLFRGAMAGKPGSRKLHTETLIASLGGEEIYYNGEDLDQKDFDVWMAVLQVFRDQPMGAAVEVSSNELLRLAGLTNTGPSHSALKSRLKRLAFTRVDVIPSDPSNKAAFYGALLQEAERTSDGKHWSLRLAPKLKALFGDGYTWLDWEIRSRLGRASLAQWLHGFYRSHRTPLPIGVERLKELSGSGTHELRFFRNDLKKALRRVQEACLAYGVEMEWRYAPQNDTIHVRWITRESEKPRKRLK
jgi:hypothetical protein